ncbi:unnamed protein product [Protopolystoma xenopodis]|uniref:Uncharacterized protein n=1 Tax=Protopolystoma xenopodis TaxID=117903 RepID=A0A3S5B910_9PLAT|nr:unnamed protein product [Protopolystoma xenopodis]
MMNSVQPGDTSSLAEPVNRALVYGVNGVVMVKAASCSTSTISTDTVSTTVMTFPNPTASNNTPSFGPLSMPANTQEVQASSFISGGHLLRHRGQKSRSEDSPPAEVTVLPNGIGSPEDPRAPMPRELLREPPIILPKRYLSSGKTFILITML